MHGESRFMETLVDGASEAIGLAITYEADCCLVGQIRDRSSN